MKRYVFIGSVEYSAYCLRALLEMGINIVDIMCPYKEVSKFNSDYYDLGEVAKEFGREAYYFRKISDESERLEQSMPDLIFVLGLSQIIPKQILEIPSLGCIGSHPALLPRNRGRHPIIWAIANGLNKSGVTLFWIDEGIDSGDIWGQEEFEIAIEDDADSVYKKVKELTVKILKKNIPDLEKGIIRRIGQDHSLANIWRKRTRKDGEIDWKMSSKRIFDLVRAISGPYMGAHCMVNGKELKIWKCRMPDSSDEYKNIEPGKIIASNNEYFTVKTGDGLLEILEHEFQTVPKAGEYL